ncbi:MAG: alcohol dehydrogenase catalytic domain-containing protein [Chloroflexi bacterium]|nr:alcohol dehydrogenase catalytic domain-containing protein [Chloroflexota bacterium]
MTLSRGAVLVAPHRIEPRDFPLPEIGGDDGLLRVELAGICGSDIHHWDGHSVVIRKVPALLGHEIVGRIEQAGAAAAARWQVAAGDRVIVEASFGCGRCEWCRRGSYQMCADEQGYGGRLSAADPPHLWGAYGQFLYLPPRARVHRVSEQITPEVGVVVGAVLANGIRWVQTLGNTGIGDTVVIFGPGPQGLACTIAAHAAGAGQIIVVGLARDRARLELARDFGATDVLVASDSTVAEIAALTGGRLADVVIDVTASAGAASQAASVVRPLGTFVMAGSKGGAPVELPWDRLVAGEIRVLGVNSHETQAVRAAVQLAESGRYPLERMLTHRLPLAQAAKGIELVRSASPADGVVKVAVDPWA